MSASPTPQADRPGGRPVPASVCISLAGSCLVGGYEFARSAAASLFIEAFGSGPMPYALTAVPVLMAALIYGYGRALTRLGSLRALQASLGASAAVFLGCYLALGAGWKPAAAALYVFTEAYIVILVDQFWSFINSTLDQERAKAFNGPILGGAALGPLLAGLFVSRFAAALGSRQFVLFSGLALLPTALFALAAFRFAGEPRPAAEERGGRFGPLHLSLLREQPILPLIAAVVALSQFVAAATSLRFYQLLEAALPHAPDARTAYLGGLYAGINGAALLMQFAVAPLVLRRLPLAATLVGVPAAHALAAVLVLFNPALSAAAGALLVYKSLDYSVFRASTELLYIPLSFDARWRAKQVVGSFNQRFSKGLAAGAISLAKGAWGVLPAWAYPAVSLAASGAWAAAALRLSRKAENEPTR
ncbi:MAG: hypothetical protein HY552_06055 [Elusimicrobia bacterium]|nr:hypothetical protein [Elusimicrobiota bacterium]